MILATVHNHTAAIGLAIAAGGAGLFIPSLFGFMRRATRSGQRLEKTSRDERHGVPFADRNYYQMRWAGPTALIGTALIAVGLIWFVVAGA